MGVFVLTNPKIYAAGYDISANFHSIDCKQDFKTAEYVAFGSSAMGRVFSGYDWNVSADGYFQSNSAPPLGIDNILYAQRGAVQTLTICPTTGASGEPAEIGQAILNAYQPFPNAFGEVASVNPSWVGAGPSVGATVLGTGTKVATGSGTAYQLGAPTATEYLYAALHVLAINAGTCTVTIGSAATEGGTYTPADLTFAAQTAVGGTWITPVLASTSDTWWKATWTLAGGCTSVTLVVSFGFRVMTRGD